MNHMLVFPHVSCHCEFMTTGVICATNLLEPCNLSLFCCFASQTFHNSFCFALDKTEWLVVIVVHDLLFDENASSHSLQLVLVIDYSNKTAFYRRSFHSGKKSINY